MTCHQNPGPGNKYISVYAQMFTYDRLTDYMGSEFQMFCSTYSFGSFLKWIASGARTTQPHELQFDSEMAEMI